MKTFTTLLSLILLVSCSKPKELMSDFASDFPTAEELTLVTRYDDIELSDPMNFVVKDSLLFVIDATNEYFCKCFNINNSQELPKFILKGMAANEMISADYLTLYGNDSINVLSFNYPRLVKTYGINSVFNRDSRNSSLETPDSITSFGFDRISETKTFGGGDIYKSNDKKKYFISEPNKLTTFGELNKELFILNIPFESNYANWDIILTTHPSKEKVAAATKSGFIIEIINLKNQTIDHSKNYEKIKLEIEQRENITITQMKGVTFSSAIGCNSENVMVVKKEKYSEDQKYNVKNFNYELLVFDWNLNPVKKYNIPFNYCLQHISQDGKFIYLLVLNEDGEKYSLIKYSIS